ncbi:hypothetical protein [Exiguobacterium sp. s56]|uniref:hypothetical protein n=1 Tax=Exiguobacterium sp. s56 TaxID=2751232 RepID=UPI001BE84529|nr:hypothetical protein [Exiguobacterium sp. s56]
MLITKQRTDSKKLFSIAAVNFMSANYEVNKENAEEMVEEYIDQINVNSAAVQHLGPDYFALQILMAKKIIPYEPM